MRLHIDVAGLEPLGDAALPALHREHAGAGHGGRERLRAAHAAQSRRQDPFAGEIAAEVASAHLGEGLVGALHDSLAADVNPGTSRHLAIHGEAEPVELVEMLPGRPVRHQIRIGDEYARCIGVGLEHAHRLAGLNQQGLLKPERLQGLDDAIEAIPIACGAADAAVHHEFGGILGDLGVEVVHEHAQRRLGGPMPGRQRLAACRTDDAGFHGGEHD